MKPLLLIFLLLIACTASAETTKRVLMVLSSHGQQQGEVQPGYEFDEFAKAYLVLAQHGVSVDIASPKGGAIEADQYDPQKAFNAKILANEAVMAKLANTLATQDLRAEDYNGIFVVGGKGAMFDFPKDHALHQLIASVYQQRGVIAAVCHGPAALVNVTLDDGSYLVANKAVNGFTNEEETLFGKKWVKTFDFMLQDKLIERGGRYEHSDIMLDHVAVDERLITGQNPSSTTSVAVEMVKALGIDVQTVEPFIGDKTLALVAKLLVKDYSAVQQLTASPNEYHIELIGMYGYYYLLRSTEKQDIANALMLMNLARSTIDNPMLDIQIAKAQKKLGDNQSAAVTLNQILAKQPELEAATSMLESLAL